MSETLNQKKRKFKPEGEKIIEELKGLLEQLKNSNVKLEYIDEQIKKLSGEVNSFKTNFKKNFEGQKNFNIEQNSVKTLLNKMEGFEELCDPDSIKDTDTFQAYVNCLKLDWQEYKKLFDLDANDKIDKKELDIFLKLFRQLNKDIVKTKDIFITLKKSVDRNHDKKIDKEELELFLKIDKKHNWNINNITKEYKELDELVKSTIEQIEQETTNKIKTKSGSGYSLLQLYGKTVYGKEHNSKALKRNIKRWGETLTKNSPRNSASFLTWARQHGEMKQKSSKSAGRTPRSQMGSSTGKVVVRTNLPPEESREKIRANLSKLMTGRKKRELREAFIKKRWPNKDKLKGKLTEIYTELSERPNSVVKIQNFKNVWNRSTNLNIKALRSYSKWNPSTTSGTSSGSSQETKKCVMPPTEGNEKIQINTYQELYIALNKIKCQKLSKRRFNEKYVLKGEIQDFMDQTTHIHKNSSRLRLFYNVDVIMSNLVSEHNVEINVPN